MDQTLSSFLSGIAPTLASAMLGPLGGVAVAGLTKILGIDGGTVQDVTKAISDGRITPEQIAEIKKMEMQYQADEKERGFRYAELAFKEKEVDANDRDSARKREGVLQDKTTRNLAYLIIAAFVGMVGATLGGWTHVDSVLAGTLIGYLSAKAEQVVSYYFGSSSGSAQKSADIAKLAGK